jgi:hypothetical protein
MPSGGRNIHGDAAIMRVAGANHRQISRDQLLALGLSDHAIARRAWLVRAHAGVYSVGGPPRTGLEHAAAALLACGEGAALCHGSAMALWGMWKRWELPIHVAIPGDRRRPGIRLHRLQLSERDVGVHHDLRVTSPARTLLDMAPLMPEAALKRRVNEARRAEILTLADITAVVERFPHHPGARRLRPQLTIRGGPTRSEWEDAFPAWCQQHELPPPVMNAIVAGYEVDALFEEEGVIVELDSWEYHQSRDSFESDRDRDATTLAAGHITVRITWSRMTAAEAERLHRILRQRRMRAAWTRPSQDAPGVRRRAPDRPTR